jgi:hypothetical protein
VVEGTASHNEAESYPSGSILKLAINHKNRFISRAHGIHSNRIGSIQLGFLIQLTTIKHLSLKINVIDIKINDLLKTSVLTEMQ